MSAGKCLVGKRLYDLNGWAEWNGKKSRRRATPLNASPLNARLWRSPLTFRGHAIWRVAYQTIPTDPFYKSLTLEPTLKVPGSYFTLTIRLLINDFV